MAEATFVSIGDRIDHTPGTAKSAGDVVVQGELVGVVVADIAANALGALHVEGVLNFTKKAATAFSAGDDAFWDDTANEATDDAAAGANKKIGRVVTAALAADATLKVKMLQS